MTCCPRPWLVRTLVAASVLLVPLTVHGLASDRDKPVHLHANAISIDQTSGHSTYRGGVLLRQGSLRITANRATAVRTGEALQFVLAHGTPATARQLLEEPPHEIIIRGETMRYDASPRRITVRGDVTVDRGRDRIHAEELTYELDGKRLEARGTDGRQIMATLWREQEPKR